MTPLARDGPKLRPKVFPLARVPGETFDLSSLVPVMLSGLHAASRGSEGAIVEPVASRSASLRPPGNGPRVGGDLGGGRLPDGRDVCHPYGDRLAGAWIEDGEGHG